MTIEDRLAKDAQAWRTQDSAPSLDDALDRITRPPARPRSIWFAAAASIVLVAAVAVAFAGWRRASTPSGNGRCTPQHVCTVPIPHLRLEAVSHGAAANTLTAYFIGTDSLGFCSPQVSGEPAVTETGSTVRITLHGARLDDGSPRFCPMQSYASVTVDLARPLGDRVVFDARSATPTTVFDPSDVPTPAYVPPGYRPAGTAAVVPGKLAAARTYRKDDGRALLSITVAVAGSILSAAPVANGPIDVNGHHARFERVDGRCLVWTSAPKLVTSVCDQGTLSRTEIIKIARSLR